MEPTTIKKQRHTKTFSPQFLIHRQSQMRFQLYFWECLKLLTKPYSGLVVMHIQTLLLLI